MNSSFTRIDLLVVVFIALLGAVLPLPGCEQTHGGARRAVCANNEKQLSMALLDFEGHNRQFPGYRQSLAGIDVGWGVMILPQIDQGAVWQEWKQGKVRKARLPEMICPLDPPPSSGPEDGWSSYAVNTLVCQDGAGLAQDYIQSKDGVGNTLLTTENLRSMKPHTWWDTEPKTVGFSVGPMAYNVQSNHGGGANVTFCDGHLLFLHDTVDDDVYKALVTPDGGEKVDAEKLN